MRRLILLTVLTWAASACGGQAGKTNDAAAATPPEQDSMYATVRRYEGITNPGEAARRVNESFVPLISKIPGFVAYYWVDAGNGVMVSTSVFQNQAAAEESNKRAAAWVKEQNLASMFPNPPQITAGKVVAHKMK
jgi:hypothetical protein